MTADPPTGDATGTDELAGTVDSNDDADADRAPDVNPESNLDADADIDPESDADTDIDPSIDSGATHTPKMNADTPPTATATDTDASLLVAYRHDVHKLRGRSHENACERVAGVRVNQSVPHGADRDAALLSRPRGDPEQTVPAHTSPFRLSLLTGKPAAEGAILPGINHMEVVRTAAEQLVTIDDPAAAHRAWLAAEAPAGITESVYYPHTSVKYHTLLTAALLSAYRAGADFEDLSLVVDEADAEPVPHRTIIHTETVSLRLTPEPGERPAAPLGGMPARSWADVWSRLPTHPLATARSRRARVLDAQLRRIRSWSVALQYIAEYEAMVSAIDRDGNGVDAGGGMG